jgi:hypothetical protein
MLILCGEIRHRSVTKLPGAATSVRVIAMPLQKPRGQRARCGLSE